MEANKTNLFLLFFLKYNEFIEQQKKKKKKKCLKYSIPVFFPFSDRIYIDFCKFINMGKARKKKEIKLRYCVQAQKVSFF